MVRSLTLQNRLISAYIALLCVPDCEWRTKNKYAYSDLAEAIAEMTGQTKEDVQNKYEFIVWSAYGADKVPTHGTRSV